MDLCPGFVSLLLIAIRLAFRIEERKGITAKELEAGQKWRKLNSNFSLIACKLDLYKPSPWKFVQVLEQYELSNKRQLGLVENLLYGVASSITIDFHHNDSLREVSMIFMNKAGLTIFHNIESKSRSSCEFKEIFSTYSQTAWETSMVFPSWNWSLKVNGCCKIDSQLIINQLIIC